MKINCWEHQECGREPGGWRVSEKGVCPAAECASADGTNGGINGGRVCWMVAGTLCQDTEQADLAAKIKDCSACGFLNLVLREERDHVELAPV